MAHLAFMNQRHDVSQQVQAAHEPNCEPVQHIEGQTDQVGTYQRKHQILG